MKRNKKIILTIVVSMILSFILGSLINSSNAAVPVSKRASGVTQFMFNARDAIKWYSDTSTVIDVPADDPLQNQNPNAEGYPFIATEISESMIDNKKILPLYLYDENTGKLVSGSSLNDNSINAQDASTIVRVLNGGMYDPFVLEKNVKRELPDTNIEEIQYSINMPEVGTIAKREPIIIKMKDGKITKSITDQERARLNEYSTEVKDSGIYSDYCDEDKDLEDLCTEYAFISAKVIMEDGREFSLVIGRNGEYVNNWYLIETRESKNNSDESNDFKTEIDYTAIITETGKNVGGTKQGSTFLPGYDKDDIKKDADVTAIIKSVDNKDIVKINGIVISETPNSEGWYYPDVNNKKEIAKKYLFADYNNNDKNGIVEESGLVLTSNDDLTSKQSVSIKWPFRIIEFTKTPNEMTNSTKTVKVEITTNLPMDKDKLPEKWNFTTDDLGKSQHKIYREYVLTDGNINEDVVIKANGRNDTDTKNVTINWKEKLPSKNAKTGESFIILGCAVAVIGIAIISYRKFKK